ncbi:hypothetical protein [Dactylosporangium sp. CA-139066]|uniref:hypothetical protein n=1 Tax=Dactylosporangium sp. CA-139066 TaxID=3239930 RepID=UPI003D89CAAA
MSTRPAEITTPYGWTELFEALRATRDAIRWIDARIDHYRDLRAGDKPAEPATTDQPAATAESAPTGAVAVRVEVSEPEPGPRWNGADFVTALAAFVDQRIEQHHDARADDPSTEPATPAGKADTSTEPEKGTDAMQPDEQQRRDALVIEEHDRQQRDLQSDGVLDGDENPEPGDGGTADLELDG